MADHRDPKEIITPYAFRVAPELLGLPLARPGRRALAMLVDLALIGVLVGLKAVSGTLFGFLLAFVLFRISSGRAPGGLRGTARAFARIGAIVVLLIALGSFVRSCVLSGPGPPAGPSGDLARPAGDDAGGEVSESAEEFSIVELGRGLGDVAALRSAETAEEAGPPAARLARRLEGAGATSTDIEEVLRELVRSERPWRDSVARQAVAGVRVLESERAAEADSLASRFARAIAAGDTARALESRERLAEELSGDRIAALERENHRLREERDRALEEAEGGGGILGFVRTLADDLGLGFGWAGLYFTVFLALWKGQTPGKRLLGLRVVRLNGQPLGWWPAFERFGGYAASLATGLLGFFQILWDANRQGVHDKIVGTVVVLDSRLVKHALVRASLARTAGGREGGPRAAGGREGGIPLRLAPIALPLAPIALLLAACAEVPEEGETVVTFPISALGAEAVVLREQLARFMAEHPEIRVIQRETPDAADPRHQLYVQWLNARASDPDVLQVDVIWTPEFAAAGWILPLDRFGPEMDAFFPATVDANRWDGKLYALPWFVDIGMLYWRTDLLEAPPATLDELVSQAARGMRKGNLPYGFLWQGARYEGLVTVFLEHLGAFGGRILDEDGRVAVDSEAGVRALTFMHDAIYESGIVPRTVLTWREEQTRFGFQNGGAVFMRNWPYAYSLMQDRAESRVAGKFSVAPMPAAPGGSPTAALGGSQLAINANTEHPEAAYAVIEYLTRPEQMLERARVVGQFPTRPAMYADTALAAALSIRQAELEETRRIIERAVPRPVTPVYTELSQILQVRLHRALTRQQTPRAALQRAARDIEKLLQEVGLTPGARAAGR